MKNKSVHSCRFVHHAKFHCIMTTLIKLFKIEFERGGGGTGKEPKNVIDNWERVQKLTSNFLHKRWENAENPKRLLKTGSLTKSFSA